MIRERIPSVVTSKPANGGKSRLNRIGRPDALPVRGREAVKSQQFFSVFLQADGRLGVLRLIGFKEPVECLLGVCFSFGPHRLA